MADPRASPGPTRSSGRNAIPPRAWRGALIGTVVSSEELLRAIQPHRCNIGVKAIGKRPPPRFRHGIRVGARLKKVSQNPMAEKKKL